MHEGSNDTSSVVASEEALSRLPPSETAKITNAPRLPRLVSHLDIQAAGTVTVILLGLWHLSPESSRTQSRTCIEDGMASRNMAV